MRAHGMRNSNQILHGDQTVLEENCTWSIPPALVNKFWRECGRTICLR